MKKPTPPPAPPPPTIHSFSTEMLLESFHKPLWRDIAVTQAELTAEAARKLREGKELVFAPEPEHPTKEERLAAGESW